jgi:probable DNA repair protein
MLAELKRLATAKLFKPENAGAPVQVMGLLEATGSVFDHLWVCGLSDDVWPPRGHASPFLPLVLQRSANVPHCRPAQEHEFAQRVTARLMARAANSVFSWPKHEDDRPLRISPLLSSLPQASAEEICGEPAPAWAELQKSMSGESFVDDQAPPPDCSVRQHGGTRVFKLQSNCPFRAFIEVRLGAKRMDEPELGIRATDKGKIIEKALELIWDQLHDQPTLQATVESDLGALIAATVDQAMAMALAPASQEWEKRYRILQRERFVAVLREWLELEKRRDPFTVVAHQRPVTIIVNGVTVNGRIDRIDRVTADGRLVILDYKSGSGLYGAGQWSGERPQEPQLPLYVVSQDEPVSAVAFAVLRTGDCAFKGYGARKEVLGFPRDNTGRYFAEGETFEQHIAAWKPVMDTIAGGYRAGAAAVDPQPQRVCEYCHATPLCRLADERRESEDSGDREHEDAE